MNARMRGGLCVFAAVGGLGGCSTVLGIESDRHLAADAAVDPWACAHDPAPVASPRPLHLKMLVNDVSTASSANSFAGNPIPGAAIRACSTLDVDCASPVSIATSDASGFALISVPSGFSGYYEIRANGFAPALISRTPQLGDESFEVGIANLALISAGGGLAGVKADPTLAISIVSVLDCVEAPAPGMLLDVGAPAPTEKLVYLANSLPSASATETDATGSAIIFNVPPGTLHLTASFASDHATLRSISTIARGGWVTFVQIRLDQSHFAPP